MSDYTIRNLREVTDAAAGHEFGQVQEARFAMAELEAEHTGVCLQRIKPGKRQLMGHRHRNAEEIFVVISGSGRVKLADEVRDIGPLDAIRVAPGVTRAFEASDEGLEILVFGPHHAGDAEIVSDFSWNGGG